MASAVWLLGLIWLMIVALYIVDMPTRPNQCYQCGVTEKLTRTLFSIPTPSGLIDDDGPFLGTWPSDAIAQLPSETPALVQTPIAVCNSCNA